MKILLAFIALFPCFSYAIDKQILQPKEKCTIHAPYGFPVTDSVTEICRTAYFVGFDTKNKVPKYVTYELTKEHLVHRVTRSNSFAKDQSTQDSALPKDYAASVFGQLLHD